MARLRKSRRPTAKQFWDRVSAATRLAELHGARFDGDTPERQIRRMAEAVVLPEAFNRHYLPHYFRDGGAAFHHLLYLVLERGKFVVARAPRGHAKSTVVTFAYTLHQVVCAGVLRAWEDGTLATSQPELHQAIQAVMDEEVARRLQAGPQTCHSLGLPEHWADGVEAAMDGWLVAQHAALHEDATIPLHWDPYIQIVAVDSATAVEFTAAIRAECERNDLLRSDWGDLTPCMAGDWDRRSHRRAASDSDWEANGVRVRAFGMGEALRGGKHREWRPTLLIGDDLDSEETTRTLLQRDAQERKITSAAEGGLDEHKRRVMLVGTPVDADCVVCRLSEQQRFQEDWTSLRFRATDGTRLLYAQKWSIKALARKERVNPEGYGSELDDRPPQDGSKPFREIHRYERADWRDLPLGKVMAFDPSLGKRLSSDYQAVVVLRGPTPEGWILVHRVELLRIPDPEQLVDAVNRIYAEERPDAAIIEAISMGHLLEVLATSRGARQGVWPAWQRIERQADSKDLRIRGLAPLVNTGVLRFPSDGSAVLLEKQFTDYPRGKKDGPDATEMALRLLRENRQGRSWGQIRHHERPHSAALARTHGRPTKDSDDLPWRRTR